jgi:hypothetical protein
MDILENCCYGKENKYTFVGNTRSTNHDITTNHGGVDAWIYIKNADGSTFYSKTLDGTFDDYVTDVVQNSDTLYTFLINSNSFGTTDFPNYNGSSDIWLKTLGSDTLLSTGINIGGFDADYGYDLLLPPDEGYIVAGKSSSTNGIYSENHGGEDGFVVRYSNTGTLSWGHCFGSAADEGLFKMALTPNGNIFAFGQTKVSGNYNPWLLKLSSTGNQLDERIIQGDSNTYPLALVAINDNLLFAGGFTNSTEMEFDANNDNHAGYIVRFDGNTDYDTIVFISGNSMEMLTDIIRYGDTLLLATIVSISNAGIFTGNHGSSDVFVAIYDLDLNIKGIYPFGGTGMDGVYEFCLSSSFLTPSNEMVVATCSESTNGHVPANYGMVDGWIFKFNPELLISGISDDAEENISIYPNPAKETLNVLLPEISTCSIKLCGINGKILKEWQNCGNINRLDIGDIPGGIYLLQINNEKNTITRKIIIP